MGLHNSCDVSLVPADCSAVDDAKTERLPSRNRRWLLRAVACAPALALPELAFARAGGRELKFSHAHTGEKLQVSYWENGAYLPDALEEINFLMRDFRTDEIQPIAPQLLDFVHRMQTTAGSSGTFLIFSAYRSPGTNEMLRRSTSGVAKRSFHTKGQALDIRFSGMRTAGLRDVATQLNIGGVGLYSSSDFLHVDVGPVRHW
jgi:uncharacterized protein YcbK (DUF882 family)